MGGQVTYPDISIHAPREGSDMCPLDLEMAHRTISIHAPREGSDDFHLRHRFQSVQFQSTLPARGATASWDMLTAT